MRPNDEGDEGDSPTVGHVPAAAARRERKKGQVLGTPIQSCAGPRCKAPCSTSISLCPCLAAVRAGEEES